MKTMAGILALLLATVFSRSAQAVDWIAVLKSDEVLEKSRSDILKMSIPELQLFANSIARCDHSLSDNEIIRNDCDVARERYDIEYGGERTLDQLLNAVWIVTELIRSG